MHPTALKIDEAGRLAIDWSDGHRRTYGVRELRDACPCASCREKRAKPVDPLAIPMLGPIPQAVKITAMQPLGNYAYSITFSDGHDTGIYTFEFLRELGEAT
jgi:DUF971 family protein